MQEVCSSEKKQCCVSHQCHLKAARTKNYSAFKTTMVFWNFETLPPQNRSECCRKIWLWNLRVLKRNKVKRNTRNFTCSLLLYFLSSLKTKNINFSAKNKQMKKLLRSWSEQFPFCTNTHTNWKIFNTRSSNCGQRHKDFTRQSHTQGNRSVWSGNKLSVNDLLPCPQRLTTIKEMFEDARSARLQSNRLKCTQPICKDNLPQRLGLLNENTKVNRSFSEAVCEFLREACQRTELSPWSHDSQSGYKRITARRFFSISPQGV